MMNEASIEYHVSSIDHRVIRNTQPETRYAQLVTRNLQPETRNPQLVTRNS